ncbi:2484_t:CDS:2 [Funneliformis geosporum]|uniref:17262_t:CDS:1 n=1 Tax=Funneliformis geosporum TaxID=1117311 RepID=A0A9W4STX6_9GLOM|nr:17262_t:CDS:2 [Funneliformis geosporum]CAI2180791.1 2484_t:CDS:2 [Funneliformis geosporum]
MNSFKANFNKSFRNKKSSNSPIFNKSFRNKKNSKSLSSSKFNINTLNNVPSNSPSSGIKTTNDISSNKEEVLLEPYNYLLSHPGKEIRTKMIEAFDYWFKVPKDRLNVITKVIEMLHNASLLIDDVEDSSTLRRGVPVAHHIYGVPATINCANYVYFMALSELAKLDNPKMLNIYTEELLNLHRGQGMELYWRDTLTCPSEKDFIEMVSNKTGGLLRLAVKLMQEASSSNEDYIELVNLVGIHFQVRDDYMNMQSQKYADNKGFCEDLTEGKFSFPIIHSIHTSDNSNRQLINILKQRTTSIDLKHFAVQIIQDTGSFEYTKDYLSKTEEKARSELKRLGGNPILEKIMDLLHVE